MKRILSIILAVLMITALFAGCAGDTNTPATTTPSATPGDSTEQGAGDEVVEESPYKFAAGKVEWDEAGWPLSGYEYETPICTTDEVLTYWTVCWTPQILPEAGLDGIDFCVEEQRLTGIDIEYIIVDAMGRSENFSVLLASDDLPDIMNQADIYYPGTEAEAVAEEHFANIYDYKEYCPNYLYYIRSKMAEDKNLYDQCFLDDTTISKFMGLNDVGGLDATTLAVRADWLDKLGVDIEEFDTIAEYEEVAKRMQVELGASYPINLLFEGLDTGSYFGCFDTATGLSTTYINAFPSPRVVDGDVQFYFSDDNARQYVETIAGWVADGLVSPDWISGTDAEYNVTNNLVGIAVMPLNSMSYYTAANPDPDCRWEIVKKPSLYEGQVHHFGISRGLCNGYGRTQISGTCENIPLAVTWCDWRYCEQGSDLSAWGVEGTLWEYNEEGRRVATEFCYANPDGQIMGFLQCTYSSNFLAEHGLGDAAAPYSYPGGEKVFDYFDRWYDIQYDGAYDWPKGVQLTEDQSSAFMRYADIDTYVNENIMEFVVGVKPMSEWDAYIEGLKDMGLEEAEAIYQEAYDSYQQRVAERNF